MFVHNKQLVCLGTSSRPNTSSFSVVSLWQLHPLFTWRPRLHLDTMITEKLVHMKQEGLMNRIHNKQEIHNFVSSCSFESQALISHRNKLLRCVAATYVAAIKVIETKSK